MPKSVPETEDPTPPKEPESEQGPISATVAQIKKVVLDVIAELDGGDDGDVPDPDSKSGGKGDPDRPKTDRETEISLRDQVAKAVGDLERERAHEKEHAELKGAPVPPAGEIKGWRHKMWGDG